MVKRKGRGRASAKNQEETEIEKLDSLVELSTEPTRKSLPVPDDIVLEICTHAHPLDVLYLARTCVTLRSILFHHSSIVAWKQTFRNVGLPLCPNDISAPHYAALFFETVCDSCGTARCRKSRKDVFWDMRLRLCVKCARKLVDVPAKCPGLPDGKLRSLVPTSHKPGQTYGKVHEPLLLKVMENIRVFASHSPTPTPADIATFIATEQAKVSRIESLSRDADEWNEVKIQKDFLREDTEMRKALVCSRLEDEGWGDQLNLCREYVIEHELVAVPKRLFYDDWLLVREHIKQDAMSLWTTEYERKALQRRKLQRYHRWVRAMQTLGDFEEDPAFHDDGIWPDGNDLRRMPLLQPILNGTVQAPPDLSSAEVTSGGTSMGVDINDVVVSPKPKRVLVDGPLVALDDDNDKDERDGRARYESDSASGDSFLPPGRRDYGECCSDSDSPVDDDDTSDLQDADDNSDSGNTGNGPAPRDDVSVGMRRVFPLALAAWRRDISLRLFDSLPQDVVQSLVGDVDLTSNAAKIAFLSRAATVFECQDSHDIWCSYSSCGAQEDTFLFYPDALRHRPVCIIENLERMEHFESGYQGPYGDCQESLRVHWSPSSLVLCEEHCTFVQRMVVSSGLDHRTATRHDMYEADARFVCKTCLDEPSDEAVKVHNWLSCIDDVSTNLSHRKDEKRHPANFMRLNNNAEARARELATRTDEEEPLSVALSELGLAADSLVSA